MAARFNIYCKKSVALLTPEELLKGTKLADLRTLAEDYPISDEAVGTAMKQLRMENNEPGAPGFKFYRLCYRPDGVRQIDIERWQTPEETRVVAAEVLEDVEARGHPALHRIQAHLSEVVDIVSVSFGSSSEEAFAPVVASEAARWIAERYDGIIRDNDDAWWELGERYKEYQLLRP